MGRIVFADSYYFLALLNPRDAANAKARSITARLTSSLILTTEFILLEVGNGLCRQSTRWLFDSFLSSIDQVNGVEVFPLTSLLYQEAVALYRKRPDKDWSLTDCTSFVIMEDRGITEALTADHHFVQAGFQVLMTSN